MTQSVGNRIAPVGAVYLCTCCGRQSRDKYGDQAIDRGWDSSCYLHCVLVHEDSIERGEDGRVRAARAVVPDGAKEVAS